MKKIISVAVVVVAIGGIAPYITGKLTQQRIEHKVALINAKLEPFSHQKETIKLEYNAGWFSSTAKTTIGKVVINHRITHGPYCTFGIASINSKFELPKEADDDLNKLFDGKDPYTIITKINFLSTIEFTVTSPNIGQKAIPNKLDSSITWEGLNYSAMISKNTVYSSFNMPKLALSEKDVFDFTINNIKSEASSDRLLDKDLNINLPEKFNINGFASIDKISFKGLAARKNVELQINKIMAQVATTKDNNYNSDFRIDDVKFNSDKAALTTGKISLNSSAKDPLWVLRDNLFDADWNSLSTASINNISLIALQDNSKAALDFYYKQQLTDNKTTIDYSESYGAKNIQFSHYDNLVNTAELGYSINGLPKKPLSTVLEGYINQFIVALNSINETSNEAFYAYQKNAQALEHNSELFAIATLQGTPSLTIDAKTLGNSGNANFNFKAALTKPDDSTSNLQALIIQAQSRVNSSLSISLAEPLIDNFIRITSQFNRNLINGDLDLITPKQYLIDRLHFINKDGNYTLNMEFKDGMFYVNGQIDPEFLQNLR